MLQRCHLQTVIEVGSIHLSTCFDAYAGRHAWHIHALIREAISQHRTHAAAEIDGTYEALIGLDQRVQRTAIRIGCRSFIK